MCMEKLMSISEVAKLLGISRVAVFKKVQSGDIPAKKVGRAYVISADNFVSVKSKTLSESQKVFLDKSVGKVISEYGETLKLLGDS